MILCWSLFSYSFYLFVIPWKVEDLEVGIFFLYLFICHSFFDIIDIEWIWNSKLFISPLLWWVSANHDIFGLKYVRVLVIYL